MSDLAAQVRRRVNDPRRLRAVRATKLLDTPADQPFDRLARLAAVTLDAPFAFVTIVDEQRSYWKACIGIDPAVRQNTVEESFCQYVVGLDAELVVGDAESDPRTRDNPSIASMGVKAWAGFPLRAPDGEVLGSFCVVDTETRSWHERDIEILRTLAAAASGEVELRAAAEQSAELARTLQTTLLPPVVPEVPGLDVGAVYHAAGTGNEVVGDFYDVFESHDGRWNTVLGDVCGKGIVAARMTGLSRFTLRGGAMREPLPSQVLAQLDDALKIDGSFDGRFVTAVLAALDPTPDGFHVTLASGGHTEPVLCDSDGCRLVSVRGTLLGIVEPLSLEDVEFDLGPGDTLVLYTDGVTEARHATHGQFETGRLIEAIQGAEGNAQAVAEAISAAVTAFAGPVYQDDVAVLVLRVPG